MTLDSDSSPMQGLNHIEISTSSDSKGLYSPKGVNKDLFNNLKRNNRVGSPHKLDPLEHESLNIHKRTFVSL